MSADFLSSLPDAALYLMQGRLSPPEDGRFQSFPRSAWQAEIDSAPKVPLRGIEWIYDLYGEGANPLETPAGRESLRGALGRANVRVASICADYFMDCPFVGATESLTRERIAKLDWLISVCPEMQIGRIVLPFVDASKISGSVSSDQALHAIRSVLARAEECKVELHLETDMSPANFRAFLREIEHPLVKVNYDSGNSGSLGFVPSEEFAAYGERIGSFHVKDRVLGGGTVPLGTGHVDFASLRAALIDVGYAGDFVMQVARGTAGQELPWLQHNALVVTRWLRGEATIN